MRKLSLAAVQCALVLALGTLTMVGLARMREEPARAESIEHAIRVEAREVQPENVPVVITGYGTVRSLDVVTIMPEVPGEVVKIHPRLDVGEVIPAGETLFAIDDREYKTLVTQAGALVKQLESSIALLELRLKTDIERRKFVNGSYNLAKRNYERVKGMLERDKVGAPIHVEAAEQTKLEAENIKVQLEQAIQSYPVQIEEVKSRLEGAKAKLQQAELTRDRTTVKAPFDARIKMKAVELNQIVAPGAAALVLADDSILEISVPLDSREARRWLRFKGANGAGTAWFSGVERVSCTVKWTEEEEAQWTGILHRVKRFDELNRTLVVAVRITAEQSRPAEEDAWTLVDGMFCEIGIEGRTMEDVYRLPRSAVSFDGTVYKVKDERLRTVEVELLHEQGEHAFVSKGLDPGDLVVTTRMVNPQENSLLDVSLADKVEPIP